MGAIDINTGIYVYDEADSQATFSGLLNLGQNNTKTAVANLQALIASQSATARNYSYNANAAIAQRGTSFTATGWTFDRWHATITATTVTRTALTAAETLWGSEYAFVHVANGTTNSCVMRQGFPSEDVAQMRGKNMVFSMPVRASSAGNTVTIAVEKSSTANAQISGTWTTINSVTVTPGLTGLIASVTAAIPQDATASGIRISVTTTNIANGSNVVYGDIIFERGTARSFFRLRSLTARAEERECISFNYQIDMSSTFPAKQQIPASRWGSSSPIIAFLQLPSIMRRVPDISSTSSTCRFVAGGTTVTGTFIAQSAGLETLATTDRITLAFNGGASSPSAGWIDSFGFVTVSAELA